jgi:hypothetical protein
MAEKKISQPGPASDGAFRHAPAVRERGVAMRTKARALFGAAIIALLAALPSPVLAKHTAWVVNRDGGDSVSVIDLMTNQVVATIPV